MKAPAPLRVFCFSPAWGLPTSGPFALKLLGCLRMAGIAHVLVHEDNARKGPKGKSPWIEDGPVRLGDTTLILEHLASQYGVDLEDGATALERARELALRRMLEEHTHQIVEHELFVDEVGWPIGQQVFSSLPPVVRTLVPALVRALIRRQLHARGLGRHSPSHIARMGIADVDAVAGSLGDALFLGGPSPRTVDATAFGMLGVLAFAPLQTPVASYLRRNQPLMEYLQRLRQRWFAG